ncbi:hypothetical protein RUMLAC_01670 [[Ruminococcus] lactaris ATCC 29176]|uniref:Uncharacterized protein n=1 Tax=[Ruminococcus] lactaris ATCC 29176 TaxID=471875 RepID=B5CQC5_9FIRM|nr:hypothetical protein RUMLAC_01670 [[Ruminococcus] lactaris ATCC 29176]
MIFDRLKLRNKSTDCYCKAGKTRFNEHTVMMYVQLVWFLFSQEVFW